MDLRLSQGLQGPQAPQPLADDCEWLVRADPRIVQTTVWKTATSEARLAKKQIESHSDPETAETYPTMLLAPGDVAAAVVAVAADAMDTASAMSP